MKISAKAEYACIAMVELASQYASNPVVQIRTIAEAHDLSPRFLVQILLQLKGAGLVTSSRGAAGGYQLTRPPEKINLAEIISVIDQTPTPQTSTSPPSSSRTIQELRGVWQEVNRAEQRILTGTTLADLVERIRESDVPSYQI